MKAKKTTTVDLPTQSLQENCFSFALSRQALTELTISVQRVEPVLLEGLSLIDPAHVIVYEFSALEYATKLFERTRKVIEQLNAAVDAVESIVNNRPNLVLEHLPEWFGNIEEVRQ